MIDIYAKFRLERKNFSFEKMSRLIFEGERLKENSLKFLIKNISLNEMITTLYNEKT